MFYMRAQQAALWPLSALQDGQWLPDGFRVCKVRDQWYKLSPRRYSDMKALRQAIAIVHPTPDVRPNKEARRDGLLMAAAALLLALWLPLIGMASAIDWANTGIGAVGTVATKQVQQQQGFTCCNNVMFPRHEADI